MNEFEHNITDEKSSRFIETLTASDDVNVQAIGNLFTNFGLLLSRSYQNQVRALDTAAQAMLRFDNRLKALEEEIHKPVETLTVPTVEPGSIHPPLDTVKTVLGIAKMLEGTAQTTSAIARWPRQRLAQDPIEALAGSWLCLATLNSATELIAAVMVDQSKWAERVSSFTEELERRVKVLESTS